jgi:RNA polymerase sigma factor (sigma-70 family)
MSSAAYKTLSSREKEILATRFLDEKSFSDMAVAMQTSEANVRQILSRALKKLRRAYAKGS